MASKQTITRRERFSRQRLTLAALLALLVALVVNLLLRTIAVKFGARSGNVLSTWSVVITTVFAVAAGAVGLAMLARRAARPYMAFRRLAVVVFVLSLAGPLAARLGLAPGAPTVGTGTFVALLLMNAATTAIVVGFLTTMPRRR
jgi:hypothetical protein